MSTRDYLAYWLSAVFAATAAGFLSSLDRDAFAAYSSRFNPVLVVAIAALAGVVSLRFLESRGWWSISLQPRSAAESFFDRVHQTRRWWAAGQRS